MKKLTSALLLISILLSSLVLALPAYAEKTELPVKWNTGYAVISIHNPYNLEEGYRESANYSTTDVITIPQKGTKITWTDPSGFAPCSVLTVSSWKQEGGEWVLDPDGALFIGSGGKQASNIIETKVGSSLQYTYITYKDNENIRLCVNGKNVDIKVYSEPTQTKSSWERALEMYYNDQPMPVSPLTGATVPATPLHKLEWYYGYVGSTSHSSSANKISNGSINYIYSDVFTVPKAGTTIYLYDDPSTDGNASSNAAVFSHWKQAGSNWVIDTSKPSIDGAKAERVIVDKYVIYTYTTTEDNENLRLCYRASLTDLSVSVRPYTVYLSSAAQMTPVTQTGKLTDATYKDASGNQQSYKVYLPEGFADKKSCAAIFNISQSTDIIDALLTERKDIAVFSFAGAENDARSFIDAAITEYKLNKEFLYLIGNEALNGDLFVNFIADASKHSSPLEAGKALLSVAPSYSSVLEGITMLAMGDSYFAGDGIGKDKTWVNKLGNKYGMNFFNYGIGGSTISNFVTTNNPMVVRIKTMEKTDADIILLEGGRNDLNKSVPFGDTDSRDTKTFNGAVNFALDYLRKTYPDALIILVTPWNYKGTNSEGHNNITYAKAMRTIAEQREDPHIVCLYAADKELTGVDMNSSTFKSQYCIKPTDISHLNEAGMELVLPKMEAFIAEAYTKFLKGNEPETTVEETTDTPVVTTDVAAESSDNEITEPQIDNGGCGSFTVFGTLAAVICGAVLVFKKKD